MTRCDIKLGNKSVTRTVRNTDPKHRALQETAPSGPCQTLDLALQQTGARFFDIFREFMHCFLRWGARQSGSKVARLCVECGARASTAMQLSGGAPQLCRRAPLKAALAPPASGLHVSARVAALAAAQRLSEASTSAPATAQVRQGEATRRGRPPRGRRAVRGQPVEETYEREEFLAEDGVSFEGLGLRPEVAAALLAAGYMQPACTQARQTCFCSKERSIPEYKSCAAVVRGGPSQRCNRARQAAAARPLLGGHNLVLAAETGSGKTLAYLAPLLSRLLQRRAEAAAAPKAECAASVAGNGTMGAPQNIHSTEKSGSAHGVVRATIETMYAAAHIMPAYPAWSGACLVNGSMAPQQENSACQQKTHETCTLAVVDDTNTLTLLLL